MDKQEKYDRTYLKLAKEWSQLSHCKRKKVGAIIVKNRMIISDGFNGTPSGFDNTCEIEDVKFYSTPEELEELEKKGYHCVDGKCKQQITRDEVLHAEANAILKCAKNGHSCDDSTIYLTLSPCKQCSKLILQSGIKRLVYVEDYKDKSGIDFLKNFNIEIVKIDI